MVRFKIKKILGILLMVIAAVGLFGFIVMSLWNGILVSVLHVGAVTFWQAVGILVLSKILFGGFRKGGGGWRGRGGPWRDEMNSMREKWHSMTPEEREKYKQEFRERCRGRWGHHQDWKKETTENTRAD